MDRAAGRSAWIPKAGGSRNEEIPGGPGPRDGGARHQRRVRPVPLPHYAAYGPRRVEELLVDSENLRLGGDDWERFWFLDQPSHLTPFRTHGGLGP